jgi:hypothetical protein
MLDRTATSCAVHAADAHLWHRAVAASCAASLARRSTLTRARLQGVSVAHGVHLTARSGVQPVQHLHGL